MTSVVHAASDRAPSPAMSRQDLALPQGAQQKLDAYLDLLAKWNRTYNLTAIRERSQMVTHHLRDALAVLPWLPDASELRVLDVGSGGGIPGIPLAIARPAWQVVLLDSNHKKVAFLTQAAIELELRNVTAVAARVEEYVADALFDVVISRAFSDLRRFVDGAARQLAPDGILVAMKGTHPDDEIAQLPGSVRIVADHALDIPGLDAERHLIVMRVSPGVASAG